MTLFHFKQKKGEQKEGKNERKKKEEKKKRKEKWPRLQYCKAKTSLSLAKLWLPMTT